MQSEILDFVTKKLQWMKGIPTPVYNYGGDSFKNKLWISGGKQFKKQECA